jgi:chromosome segregation ATPase
MAHASRIMGYQTKMREKERALRQRERQVAHLRHLRREEAHHRADYIAMHAKQAAERDEAYREAISSRLEDKAARADALARQRRALEDQVGSHHTQNGASPCRSMSGVVLNKLVFN